MWKCSSAFVLWLSLILANKLEKMGYMLMLACYASQNLIKSFFIRKKSIVCKTMQIWRQVWLSSLPWEITYQRIFFPYIMLSLERSSIQFTNLSYFLGKDFFSIAAPSSLCITYLTVFVQLHSKLNSFSASGSLIHQLLENSEKRGGVLLFPDDCRRLQGLSRCSGSPALAVTDILS